MKAERRAELAGMASEMARGLVTALPSCEESSYVAGRVFAMVFANGLDIDDACARGLTPEDMVGTGAMAEARQTAKDVLEIRMVHEHKPTGKAN